MRRYGRRTGRGERLAHWRGKRWWPYLSAGIALLIAAALLWGAIRFGPVVWRSIFGGSLGDNNLPSENTTQILDMTDRTKEVLLTGRNANISRPAICGDEIIFVGSTNYSGNADLALVNIYDVTTREATTQPEIERQHDMILSIAATQRYIAYFDGYLSGGGDIYAFDRTTLQTIHVATVDYDYPEVFLTENDCVVWKTRTGETTEKLYLCTLPELELTTLAVFENSTFGLSAPGTGGNVVVWAEADTSHTDAEQFGAIRILSMEEGEINPVTTYLPDMYVYRPVTDGTARAWLDSPGDDGAVLYLSVGTARPRKVDDGVGSYAMGDGFLAYGKGGAVFAYFYETGQTARLSKPGEYCWVCAANGDIVVWFDITDEERERDILRYAILD